MKHWSYYRRQEAKRAGGKYCALPRRWVNKPIVARARFYWSHKRKLPGVGYD